MIEQAGLLREHVRSRADLDKNVVLCTAAVRWLEVLGEAAVQLDASVRDKHPEVPWRDIIGMRNILIHAYPDIVLDRVWAAIELLPGLSEKLTKILEDLPQ